MKGLLIAALLSVLAPLTASAGGPPQIDRNDDDGRPPQIRVRPGEFYRGQNGRHYAIFDRVVCDLSHVALYVTGDKINIKDVDVLFGNGETQDIPVREKFKRGSTSNWKVLEDGRGRMDGDARRCIQGFSVKARPDSDWDDSRIFLYGLKHTNWGPQSTPLGSIKIRDLEIFERF